MSFKRIATYAATALVLASTHSYADDLVNVYHQALKNDPTYKKAEGVWRQAETDIPLARASLLPDLGLTGTAYRNYTRPAAAGSKQNYSTTQLQLTFSQPLINFADAATLKGARATYKAATATYAGALQNLISRTASAYFAVLKDSDQLRYVLAQKAWYKRQLQTAKQKYKVGLIAITGVYQAKSHYDSAMASEIKLRNTLETDLEKLSAITGKKYTELHGLSERVPLITPKPQNIDAWVKIATQHNISLQEARFKLEADKQTIKADVAGHYPTLSAIDTLTSATSTATNNKVVTRSNLIGLSLSMPIFDGFSVLAQTKKDRAAYATDSAALEAAHRSTVSETRQAYLSIISGASQIRADIQAINSAINSLKSTQAGYIVGTQTMVDVLDNIQSLYEAQKQYASDQYDFISNIIALKKAAGTLKFDDIAKINRWLTKRVVFGAIKPQSHILLTRQKTSHPHTKKSHHKTVRHKKIKAAHHHHYTIQLYASKNKAHALSYRKQLIAKGVSAKDLHVVKVKRSHHTQYKVDLGHYHSRKQARAALKKLPKHLHAAHPWVVRRRG